MEDSKKYLCRDINGNVHIVSKNDLVQRSSVYAVIKNEDGVLLVHDRTNEEKWDLPGGGVDPGEELLEALNREVEEETKLKVVGEPTKICEFTEYFFDVDSQKGWESTRYFYLVQFEGDAHLDGNNDDVVEARFFKEPLSPDQVMPVAREIVAMSEGVEV